MTQGKDERSKLKFFLEGKGFWGPEKPAEYMKKLTRKQASTIFKARTRMIKVKGNYKNGFPDLACRACKNAEESQMHVLQECRKLNPEISTLNGTPDNPDNETLTRGQYPDTLIHTLNDPTRDTDIATEQSNDKNIFDDDTERLRELAKSIDNVLDKLMSNDK